MGRKMHRSPPAERAVDPDSSTHQFDEALGYRQPQARSSELPRRRGINLREAIEDRCDAIRGNPDSSVRHSEVKCTWVRVARVCRHHYGDFAAIRKFDCVYQKIQE